MKYNFIEVKREVMVSNRYKFTAIKTPENIGHSDNSSDFSCRSLSSYSTKSSSSNNLSKYSKSTPSNDNERRLFNKFKESLYLIQKDNENKLLGTSSGMFSFEYILQLFLIRFSCFIFICFLIVNDIIH